MRLSEDRGGLRLYGCSQKVLPRDVLCRCFVPSVTLCSGRSTSGPSRPRYRIPEDALLSNHPDRFASQGAVVAIWSGLSPKPRKHWKTRGFVRFGGLIRTYYLYPFIAFRGVLYTFGVWEIGSSTPGWIPAVGGVNLDSDDHVRYGSLEEDGTPRRCRAD